MKTKKKFATWAVYGLCAFFVTGFIVEPFRGALVEAFELDSLYKRLAYGFKDTMINGVRYFGSPSLEDQLTEYLSQVQFSDFMSGTIILVVDGAAVENNKVTGFELWNTNRTSSMTFFKSRANELSFSVSDNSNGTITRSKHVNPSDLIPLGKLPSGKGLIISYSWSYTNGISSLWINNTH